MAAKAVIFRITAKVAPNNYGFMWKDQVEQADWDEVVVDLTKAQAFTQVATKFNNLPGNLQIVECVGE